MFAPDLYNGVLPENARDAQQQFRVLRDNPPVEVLTAASDWLHTQSIAGRAAPLAQVAFGMSVQWALAQSGVEPVPVAGRDGMHPDRIRGRGT